MHSLPLAYLSDEALPEGSSLDVRVRWPAWLLLLSGLLIFSPLIEGGTTHQAVMIIRLMILSLMGLYLAGAIRAGSLTMPSSRIGLPILAYLGLATILTVSSAYTNHSLQWLMVLLSYGMLLYVLVSTVDQWNHVGTLLVVVTGMGVLEAGLALGQGAWFGAIRPNGSFFNPNFLAGYLVVSWSLVLGSLCYVVRPDVLRNRVRDGWAQRMRLGASIAILALLFAAVAWTGSRGGFVAILVSMGLVIGLRFGRRWMAVLLLMLLSLGFLIPNPLRDRLWAEHVINPVSYARWQIWQSATREMAEHPLGIGLGLYQYIYPRHAVPIEGQIARYGKVAQTTHNEYLQMGVELGVAGLAMFCWGAIVVAREAGRALKQRLARWQRGALVGLTAAVAGILVHAALDSNLHEPAIAIMLTLCVALILAIRRLSARPVEPMPAVPVRSKVLWAGAGALVIVGMSALVIKVGLAWMVYEQGSRALTRQDFGSAIAGYETAAALDPGKALYHSSMAAAYFQAFQRTKDEALAQVAIEELQRAIALNPLDGRLPGLLGHVYVSLASNTPSQKDRRRHWLGAALSSYERAQELDPFTPFHRFEQGRIQLLLGHREKAEAAVRQAVEMEPNFLPGREWLSRLYLDSGRIDAAEREYRQILERQQRYVDWVKDPTEERYLRADASALQAALERRRPPT